MSSSIFSLPPVQALKRSNSPRWIAAQSARRQGERAVFQSLSTCFTVQRVAVDNQLNSTQDQCTVPRARCNAILASFESGVRSQREATPPRPCPGYPGTPWGRQPVVWSCWRDAPDLLRHSTHRRPGDGTYWSANLAEAAAIMIRCQPFP